MRSNTLCHTLIYTTAHRQVICMLQSMRGAPHEVQVEGLPDVLREVARERVVHAGVVYPEVVLLPLRTGAPAISSPAQAVLNFGLLLAHTHSAYCLSCDIMCPQSDHINNPYSLFFAKSLLCKNKQTNTLVMCSNGRHKTCPSLLSLLDAAVTAQQQTLTIT